MAKGNYLIPFDRETGHQLSYPYMYAQSDRNDWRDNDSFEDTLTFLHFERGRSAAHAIFQRKNTGTRVTVFLKELSLMMPFIRYGMISGVFEHCKRGTNYGTILKVITNG
jgi:hypothetical protein